MGPFVGSSSAPLENIGETTGDEVDPETFKRDGDGLRQADLDAAMVGLERLAVAFGWVVEC